MKIHCESIGHYVNWLATGYHFAFAGYSDAEWYCMMGLREGGTTALGQTLSKAHGELLLDVMRRRQGSDRFLFAIPKCLYGLPEFSDGQIDWFLGSQGIKIEGYERDMVTDDLARQGDMYPFIRQLQSLDVCVIGPPPLRGCLPFLRYKAFIDIETPNLHMSKDGIDRAIGRATGTRCDTFLVSAGVSAACIIDGIWQARHGCWTIDCGSMWDGFVGIGGQRQWRADLYADKAKWKRWHEDNTQGKHSP